MEGTCRWENATRAWLQKHRRGPTKKGGTWHLPRHPYLTTHSCACDTGSQVAFVSQEKRLVEKGCEKWQVGFPKSMWKDDVWQQRWASILVEFGEPGLTKEGKFRKHSRYMTLEKAEQMVVELVPHPHTNPNPPLSALP